MLVSDSDRESTSSNLSGVNERKMHINQCYPSVCLNGENLDTTLGSNIIEAKVNSSSIASSFKRNNRRGRPPKKEIKSRSKFAANSFFVKKVHQIFLFY